MVLSGSPSLLTIWTSTKLASKPPIISPIPGNPSFLAFFPCIRDSTRKSRCWSRSSTLCLMTANPSDDKARIANAEAGEEMLYGAFMQLSKFAISGDENAIPRRIPASPNAFERVCRTIRLGYWVTAVHNDDRGAEKSIYASSNTKTPFQNDLVTDNSSWTEEGEMSFPVGFPGEVTRIILIVGSAFKVFAI